MKNSIHPPLPSFLPPCVTEAFWGDLGEDEGVAVEYLCEAREFISGGTAIGATCL